MYAHTESFITLREQSQSVLDFAVLIANSVPLLKMTLKKIDQNVAGMQLANPDYFKGQQNPGQLKQFAQQYKNNLGKYVLLSNFSYFEAYVSDAIDEIFKFHGGVEAMIAASQLRCSKHVNPTDVDIVNNRKKLQDSYDRHKKPKYMKYTNLLKKKNFKFPSELLSAYGVRKLKEDLKNLRSVGIPDILMTGLHFDMKEAEVQEFHKIRDIRNAIAHGKRKTLDIPRAMECNRFLRDLAVRIDNHIVSNYFVIEEFA